MTRNRKFTEARLQKNPGDLHPQSARRSHFHMSLEIKPGQLNHYAVSMLGDSSSSFRLIDSAEQYLTHRITVAVQEIPR